MRCSIALLLSASGWLQLTQAACCRSNSCLKAIVDPFLDGHGIADCSSILAVTQTAPAITETFTSTIAVSPAVSIQATTVVETTVETATETITASTETRVLATVTETTTVSTRTQTQTNNVLVIGSTGTVTQTLTLTATLPASTVTGSWTTSVLERRDPGTATSGIDSQVPSYAASICPSWEKYLAACRCAGVTSVPTVTVAVAPVTTTVVVDEEQATVVEVSTVLSAITSTATETTPVTATEQVTQTNTAEITAVTTTRTVVTRPYNTVTVTSSATTTVTPSAPVTVVCQDVPRSNIQITSSGVMQVLYADVQNGMTGIYGNSRWLAPGSVAQPDRVRYQIDSNGVVVFTTSTYPTVMYIDLAALGNTASARPSLMLQSQFDYYVGLGRRYVPLKGCVEQASGNLQLSIAGLTSALSCGGQFWMSSGTGSDTGLPCNVVSPVVAPV